MEAKPEKPIIIGGCLRSGTSLIRRIINSHSRIYCGPEVKFFRDFYNDYFDDPLAHIRFLGSARKLIPEETLLAIAGAAFVKILKTAARNEGKYRWADKCPENMFYLNQWDNLLQGNWQLLHVFRNPLDTIASFRKVKFPLSIPADLNNQILFYRRYIEVAIDHLEIGNLQTYPIQYEKLVLQPKQEIRKMMNWLGEPFEEQQLKFNEKKHQEGLEDPKIKHTSQIVSSQIGRWQETLSRDEAKTVWDETNDLWKILDPDNIAGIRL